MKELRELALRSLEAARIEVVERMKSKGFPTSIRQPQLVAKYKEGGTGSQSEWTDAQVSSLRNHEVQIAIRDDSVPHMPLGLKPQLGELAEYLADHTDLGAKRPMGFLPNLEGVDGVLARCIIPLAQNYLSELQDVARPDAALAEQLVDELVDYAQSDALWHVRQLTLVGTQPVKDLAYRDVSLRPLNPYERGAIWENDVQTRMRSPWTGERGYWIPNSPIFQVPDSVLAVKTSRPGSEIQDQSRLLHCVVLAFFLSNVPLRGFGDVYGFDLPAWASGGTVSSPLPLDGRGEGTIDEDTFSHVIDLAYHVPDFTNQERTPREIALDRALKGYGAQRKDAGFLDFMIALEATLLSGIRDELRYRFSLYGALFLRHELKPEDTFKRLRNAYDVRSGLVHGSPVDPDDRTRAVDDALDLATRILRRAIEYGWPNPEELHGLALSFPATD